MIRKIIFFENYFIDFYKQQDEKVKSKIQYVFELIRQVDKVPEKFLKHLTGTNDYTKSELNISQIFLGFSAASIKAS